MALPTGNLSRTDGGKLFLFVEIGSKIFSGEPPYNLGGPKHPNVAHQIRITRA